VDTEQSTELLRDVLPVDWAAVHTGNNIVVTAPTGKRYVIYPNPVRGVGGWFVDGTTKEKGSRYVSSVATLRAILLDHGGTKKKK